MTSHQVSISSRPWRSPPKIGAPLRALLDERFITQAELAQALGVSEGNVSRWVRNETGPQKRRLRQIAEYFKVEPGSLVETEKRESAAA